ncbi:MAG: type III pantothenate kinase [Treponema sp.]|uniref:type III pantothenate kinase n=1 Tax=Treponema sp. TaxID=166 RepID=UPI001B487C48|nr:type III pantothenate kinase [Treponema sp.]MBP5587600.1 type III pantothenate kinase [Treponema sp.]MCR5385623.1 type III pantothenate kinase [Treponema sp.]
MILTIDVGNTTIQGGLFDEDGKNVLIFRRSTSRDLSSDEAGLFFRNVIELNGFDYTKITQIACCSVVPSLNYSLSNAFKKYFKIDCLFVQAGIKTGLKLKYSNPKEIGADRIAAAIGASNLYEGKNLIVVDMGTATTIDIITKEKEYLGGAILPGIKMSSSSLASGTAKLPAVEIVKPERSCGTSTVEAIQSGIYFGQLGGVKEIIGLFTKEVFNGEKPYLIGTGGFSRLYENEKLFDSIVPELVHIGLKKVLELN